MFRFMLLALFITIFSVDTEAEDAAIISWRKDLPDAVKDSQEQDRPIFLFLTMPGCSYCQRMKQESLGHRKVIEYLNKHYVAVEVDGRNHPELAKSLKVRFYPTTAILSSTGEKVVGVVHGYKDVNEFARQLATLTARAQPQLAAQPRRRTN